ncbi:MAG: hypothetical protein RR505_11685 [Raoultibacter sp.]
MTAKEYLMQVRFIDRLIDSKLEQAAQLKATATKATATLSDMPRSDSPDLQSMETNIIKMIDLEREINRDVDRLVDLKKEAMCAIVALPNIEHQLVLEQRYLCFKSWGQISENMCYSLRHVTRLHGEALKAFLIPEKSCP